MVSNSKLFIVVNVDWFFLSHRLPIALRAIEEGYDVTILAIEEEGLGDEIRSHGLAFISLPSSRGGMNPIKDIGLIRFLYKVYQREKPDIIHHVAIKPVLYGSIAARLARSKKIINAVSGLGSMFINPNRLYPIYQIISRLYKIAFQNPRIHVIIQNNDDKEIIKKLTSIIDGKIHLIEGSGVDLSSFQYTEEPDSLPIQIALVSRMLWDKGIGELVEASKVLKKKHGDGVEVILAGKVDPENKSSIAKDQLVEWTNEGWIKWVGFQTDIVGLYRSSHIAVLPSYREGLPKSLIEGMAIGRPVVTTDAPGCRSVVDEGYNGFKVPIKDVELLADRLDQLISSKELRNRMGINSRKLAEEKFSLKMVLDKTFEIYKIG